MAIFYLAQIALPLLLLAWLRWLPPASKAAMLALSLASALWFAAIWLTGIWLIFPRWIVLIFAACLIWLVWRCGRGAKSGIRSGGGRDWAAIIGGFVLTGGAVTALVSALGGRSPPAGQIVALASPLPGTGYFVANGGYSQLTNGGHHMTLDQSVPRFRAFYGQSMAVDLLRLNRWGRTTEGLRPGDPSKYAIFGNPVLAPCSGRVTAARGDRPDNPVPQMDRTVMLGNHAIVQCGKVQVVLAHFRADSLRIKKGQSVRIGDQIAEVGNSGNSGEPHLHIHAQTPSASADPVAGKPLPITLSGQFLVRNDTL